MPGRTRHMIETEVRLWAGRPTPGDTFTIDIEDARSHEMIVSLELDPQQFLDLLTNKVGVVAGAKISTGSNLGLYAEHGSVIWPRQYHVNQDEEAPIEVRVQAMSQITRENPGTPWIYLRSYASNQGRWTVHFVRYHQTKPEGWRG